MINPKYEYLREYVERIPKDFETIGTVIHSGRNLIKMIKRMAMNQQEIRILLIFQFF